MRAKAIRTMADNIEVLHAVITAADDASATLDRIGRHLREMRASAEGADHAMRHVEHASMWARMSEHTELFKDRWGEVGVSLGETGHRIGELIPALGALGAVGSAVGLVEMTHEAAEARTQLNAMAETLGLSVQQLQAFRLMAQETDVPVEALQTGVVRLQRAMVDAASGKGREQAAIFHQMGISLRDAGGQMRSVEDVLPRIAESLSRMHDTTLRNAVVMRLFGRSGAELVPLLDRGAAGMREFEEASRRLNATYTPEQNEQVEEYKNSWIELDTAMTGLKDTLTAELAPAFTPIIEGITEWIAANREWLGTDIRVEAERLEHALMAIPWHTLGSDVLAFAHAVEWGAEKLGGWHRVIELVAGFLTYRLALAFLAPLANIGLLGVAIGKLAAKLVAELAGAWLKVETAAEGAAAAEGLAAKAGVAAPAAAAPAAATGAAAAAAPSAAAEGAAAAGGAAETAAGIGAEVAEGAAAAGTVAAAGAGTIALAAPAALAATAVGGYLLWRHFHHHANQDHPALHDAPPVPAVRLGGGLEDPSPMPELYSPAAGGGEGHVAVSVNIQGLPQGSKVSTSESGIAHVAHTDLGFNNPLGDFGGP